MSEQDECKRKAGKETRSSKSTTSKLGDTEEEEEFGYENVLEAIDDYDKYVSKGHENLSDIEDSGSEFDDGSLTTISASSISDQDNSSSDPDDDPWEPPEKVTRKRCRSGEQKTSSSATKCPFPPAPKNCSEKKRIHSVVPVDEPEDTKQVVNILRNKISLLSDSNRPKLADPSNQISLISKSVNLVQSFSSLQDWVVELRNEFQGNPKKILMDHFKESYRSKLSRELEKEFYYWAQLSHQGDLPSNYKYWMAFARMQALEHPVRRNYSDEEFSAIMTGAGLSCLLELTELEDLEIDIANSLTTWRNKSLELLEKKMNLLENYRTLETNTELNSRPLDEGCDFGKKTLLEKFMSPYFKLSPSDSLQLVHSSHFVKNLHGDAFLHEKKQKWTSKDLETIKKIIHDVVLEKEYGKRVETYNYHQSRIAFKGTMEPSTSAAPSSTRYFPHGRCRGNNFKRPKATAPSLQEARTTLQRGISLVGTPVKAQINFSICGKSLQKWFLQEEAKLMKLSFEDLIKSIPSPGPAIDWEKVSGRMVTETGKERSDLDCRLVWNHVVNPTINNKRWTVSDTKKLVELAKAKRPWDDIGEQLNRTPYQCFFRFRNSKSSPNAQNEVMKWDEKKDADLLEILRKNGPKWNLAVEVMMDHGATKHQVQERWKKSSSPIIRHGAFTRVEDALLLLTVEKLRNFIKREGHFGILLAYLPWRYETVWRDRANSLFSNWIVPWTVEEDKKLLELVRAQSGRRNWQEIAEHFTSFKNRKGCLTRHKILMSKLGDGPKKFKSVEEYHEAYSMTRYNVFQYKHLIEVTQLLKRILTVQPLGGTWILSRDEPPEEWQLRGMLLDFDRTIVQDAIANLEAYMKSRDCYWKEWMEQNGGLRKTFDRRTFKRDDPQSVASAIHIRGLELKSPSELARSPTEFQSEVMYHFARFKRTKPLKRDEDVKRPYIPSAQRLCEMNEIGDIIKLPVEEPMEVEVPMKATTPKKVSKAALKKSAGQDPKKIKASVGQDSKKVKASAGQDAKKMKASAGQDAKKMKASAAPIRTSQRLKKI